MRQNPINTTATHPPDSDGHFGNNKRQTVSIHPRMPPGCIFSKGTRKGGTTNDVH
ncbi:hypothetical protein LSH36_692g02012 [Paralvinella palmiformis]|uniref:Uncharacterized protein n=1 Tax=Paralvinella palmiformis TaxID=53620 RepID=A0AAD9MW68_9ANNE|nr:hypothetical protein LSH36_692g02012 [Paralvinella palmiformis]